MGQAGRNLVTGEYDWGRIVERWLNELGVDGYQSAART